MQTAAAVANLVPVRADLLDVQAVVSVGAVGLVNRNDALASEVDPPTHLALWHRHMLAAWRSDAQHMMSKNDD